MKHINNFYKITYTDIGLDREDIKFISNYVKSDAAHSYENVIPVLEASCKIHDKIDILIEAIEKGSSYEVMKLFHSNLQYSRSSFHDCLHIANALLAVHIGIITDTQTVSYINSRVGMRRVYGAKKLINYTIVELDEAAKFILQANFNMYNLSCKSRVEWCITSSIMECNKHNVFTSERERLAVLTSVNTGCPMSQVMSIYNEDCPIGCTAATLGTKRQIVLSSFIDKYNKMYPAFLHDDITTR